jgi:hypothetical protein
MSFANRLFFTFIAELGQASWQQKQEMHFA